MPNSRRAFFKKIFGVASTGTQSRSSSASPRSSAGFKIVQNGKALAMIVTPDAPSPVVEYAARELQLHVHRATGVTLTVIPESDPNAAAFTKHLYVGPGIVPKYSGVNVDDLPPNSFIRKVTADAVFLIGKDGSGKPDATATTSYVEFCNDFKARAPSQNTTVSMGTLFAVYDWLEEQVGVKWLDAGEEALIPAAKVLFAGDIREKKVIAL